MINWKAGKKLIAERQAEQNVVKDTILVVDDEEPNRNLFRSVLSREYHVVTAESGQDALEKIREHNFVSIVSDQRMPGMTGVEFFIELNRLSHPAPRIILTGFAELNSVIQGVNEGKIARYLTKPIEPELLLATIRDTVQQHKIRSENMRLISLVKQLLEENAELAKKLALTGQSAFPQSDEGRLSLQEPKKLHLAVLFVDIRGFTQFSANTPATLVMRTLQLIFEPIHSIIYSNGGIVDKHLGDGLMAVFGLTDPESGNLGGIQALKQIVSSFPSILQGMDKPEFRSLKLSVGLADGEVLLGMLGTRNKTELAVIGQPANLASRLQEFTKQALETAEGQQLLGKFPTAMGICTANLAEKDNTIRQVALPQGIRVRDFPSIERLGVIEA